MLRDADRIEAVDESTGRREWIWGHEGETLEILATLDELSRLRDRVEAIKRSSVK